jgi:hypothetical protein
MFQQNSCFTFHLPGSNAIEEVVTEGVTKFIIPSRFKADLQLTLRRMGIHYASLYYDLDHLALEMKAELQHPEGPTAKKRTRSRGRKKNPPPD